MKKLMILFALSLLVSCGEENPGTIKKEIRIPKDPNVVLNEKKDHKLVIYQMMTRLFGNKKTADKYYGTVAQNGVGKFNDINGRALKALKKLGITYIWYTGVLEHAQMRDYRKYGIRLDDADVVKGRAGSPYAIKDYYDVDPDLAVNVRKRKDEFKALIKRTHAAGLGVLIDFVPNHVARAYHSDAKPKGVKDLGANDDKTKAFAPNNNFYYIPGKAFVVPKDYDPLGSKEKFITEDGKFKENPAKVTGNDQFTATPTKNDWFETVKLNYGVDIQHGRKTYFNPIPSTWKKMRDILIYWVKFGVDGFRCDMAEMVPVEFWGWAIPQVKKVNPNIIFIAEIYNPYAYKKYIKKGHFDYLYDKVGLYDSVKALIKRKNKSGKTKNVYWAWRKVREIAPHMLTFLENHDEQRLASKHFCRNPELAIPGELLVSTLYSGPTMIYFGQEVGEPGAGREGFSGNDGRTTIFDYWGVPEHQKWMNGGKFDGGKLSKSEKKLRAEYSKILNMLRQHPAIKSGNTYDLNYINFKFSPNYNDKYLYSYIRYTTNEALLFVYNFQRADKENKYKGTKIKLKIPAAAWKDINLSTDAEYRLKPLYHGEKIPNFKASSVTNFLKQKAGIPITLAPYSFAVYKILEK